MKRAAFLALAALATFVGFAWAAAPTATVTDVTDSTITLGSLKCDTTYNVRLRTRNADGTWSAVQTLNPTTSACAPPPPPPPPPDPGTEPAPIAGQGYHEVFRDDFNGSALNAADWNDHTFWLTPIPGSVAVHDGMVSLYNRRSDGFPDSVDVTTGPEWGGGGSGNPAKHDWTYGYFEARMKYTDAKGAWPAFWFISTGQAQWDGNCPRAEMNYELDAFEGQGDEPTTYYGTQHRNTNDYCGTSDSTAQPPVWPQLPTRIAGDWHTFGVKWTPDTVSYFLDGQQVGSTQPTLDSGHQPEFMSLTMQACGWDSTNGCDSTTPDTLELDTDYVTVWQQ
jgi:hypothetical protein